MNTEKSEKKYFFFEGGGEGLHHPAGLLLFLLGLDGLSLRQHGADLVGDLLVVGLDLLQNGVDLGLVVAVNLKWRGQRL